MTSSEADLLRVTVIDPYGARGGAERWLLDILGVVEGCALHAILLRDGPLREDLERLGIPVDVLRTGRSAAAIAWAGVRLPRSTRRTHPDVVLANGVKAAAVAAVSGRRVGAPIVWAKHDFSHDRRLGRRLARRVGLVVGTSPAVVASIGLPNAPVTPPPRSSAPPAGRPAAATHWRTLGVDTRVGPTAVIVSRLTPYKRVEDAIRALRATGCEDWRLVVVGAEDWASPGERARLEAIADAEQVADRVRFTGEVADAGHWLGAFDAVIVPTGIDAEGIGGEGFGIVVLEGLLAGVPVIATEGVPALTLSSDAVVAVARHRPDEIGGALRVIREHAPAAARAARDLWKSYPDAREVAADLVGHLRSVVR